MSTLIFTEAYNCVKVVRIALQSFNNHHPDRMVHVFGTKADKDELASYYSDNILPNYIYFVDTTDNTTRSEKFRKCHEGTATVFAEVFSGAFSAFGYTHAIHFDSDIFFKKESISLIEQAFDDNYDIVGSRRCYVNNPADIIGLDGIPDTVSTYFFGMKLNVIPKYEPDYFVRMCLGGANPVYKETLDFFDGVTHAALNNGAKIKFLDFNLIGGQDERGKKVNNYKTNMHMDCGSHLIHFGGVGSGCAFADGKSTPTPSYANWALGRWSLFSKLFYGGEYTGCTTLTEYKSDGRWVNGNYDEKIFVQLQVDLRNFENTNPTSCLDCYFCWNHPMLSHVCYFDMNREGINEHVKNKTKPDNCPLNILK